MHQTSLRRVGGSVMVTVPPAMLNALGLEAGTKVGLRLEGERLVIERVRPRYSLHQLLAEQVVIDAELGTAADAEWLTAPPVGREEI